MKAHYILALLAIVPFFSQAQTTQMIGTTEVTIDTLTSEMTIPWEIRVENNEYLWVTERGGILSRVNLTTGVKTIVMDLTSSVQATGEGGLLGMALHPQFSTTPEVFLVYTYGQPDGNGMFYEKLVKYTFNGTTLTDPVELLNMIPAAGIHNGSRLMFMEDNTLLMSTGDHGDSDVAQIPSALGGKYLRLNTDGSVPEDNPFNGSHVYSLGHRNSQGIAILPDGTIVISEHGPSTDDEISVLAPGKNYGWPLVHGFCDQGFESDPCETDLYTEPIQAWSPTIATSDMVYYRNDYFPEWNNRLLMTTLNGQKLVAMQLNQDVTDVTDEDVYFQGQYGRLRDIAIGPNMEIYIATNNGGTGAQPILRITPPYFLGTEEFATHDFLVYPNPVNDLITIRHDLADAEFVIVDLNGNQVFSVPANEKETATHAVKLLPGFYYAELTQNGVLMGRQKLMKL